MKIKVKNVERKVWRSPEGKDVRYIELIDNENRRFAVWSGLHSEIREGDELECDVDSSKAKRGRTPRLIVKSITHSGEEKGVEEKREERRMENREKAFALSYAKDIVVAMIEAKMISRNDVSMELESLFRYMYLLLTGIWEDNPQSSPKTKEEEKTENKLPF